MRVKDFNFPGKIWRILNEAGGLGSVRIPFMGCFASRKLSYTALWQSLNSLCEQERQALKITKTLA